MPTKPVSAVIVGQKWKRANGVVCLVAEERTRKGKLREVLLLPVEFPANLKPRQSWKWDESVKFELTLVE
jgi:hypothetical protein